MLGQLNLFTFKPRMKVFYPTPIALNKELWALVRKTDPRGYSFGTFDEFFTAKRRPTRTNISCLTVAMYNGDKPIGFCTLSYLPSHRYNWRRTPLIDVWVMPYYRDLGFGSLLVNRTNQKSLDLTGKLPSGHDKNHTHCWDARVKKVQDNYSYEGGYYIPDGQLMLFNKETLHPSKLATVNRMLTMLSKNTELDFTLMQACVKRLNSVAQGI